MDEANLRLFHVTSQDWEEAPCAGYAIERFPEDNLVAVPVCQTGVFALSDGVPYGTDISLPLVLRNH